MQKKFSTKKKKKMKNINYFNKYQFKPEQPISLNTHSFRHNPCHPPTSLCKYKHQISHGNQPIKLKIYWNVTQKEEKEEKQSKMEEMKIAHANYFCYFFRMEILFVLSIDSRIIAQKILNIFENLFFFTKRFKNKTNNVHMQTMHAGASESKVVKQCHIMHHANSCHQTCIFMLLLSCDYMLWQTYWWFRIWGYWWKGYHGNEF